MVKHQLYIAQYCCGICDSSGFGLRPCIFMFRWMRARARVCVCVYIKKARNWVTKRTEARAHTHTHTHTPALPKLTTTTESRSNASLSRCYEEEEAIDNIHFTQPQGTSSTMAANTGCKYHQQFITSPGQIHPEIMTADKGAREWHRTWHPGQQPDRPDERNEICHCQQRRDIKQPTSRAQMHRLKSGREALVNGIRNDKLLIMFPKYRHKGITQMLHNVV